MLPLVGLSQAEATRCPAHSWPEDMSVSVAELGSITDGLHQFALAVAATHWCFMVQSDSMS